MKKQTKRILIFIAMFLASLAAVENVLYLMHSSWSYLFSFGNPITQYWLSIILTLVFSAVGVIGLISSFLYLGEKK